MPQTITGRPYLILLILLALGVIFSLLRFGAVSVGSSVDDAHYVVLAESLATGRGYRLVNYPDAPREPAFPPGWPLLLTPLAALFPGNLTLMKGLSFFLWLGSLPLIYRLLSTRLEWPHREMAMALVAFNPWMVQVSGMLTSEAAYLFFSMLALALLQTWIGRAQGADGRVWPDLGLMALGGVLAVYAALIRTVGIALIVAALSYATLRQRKGLVVWGVVAAACALPLLWLGRGTEAYLVSPLYRQHATYILSGFVHFGDAWRAAAANSGATIVNAVVPLIGPAMESLLASGGLGWLPLALSALLTLIAVFGLALSLRRPQIMDLYAFWYLVILFLWVSYVGALDIRFLIPILPFLYMYLFVAVGWLTGLQGLPGPTGSLSDPIYVRAPAEERGSRPAPSLPRASDGEGATGMGRAINAAVVAIVALALAISAGRNLQEWRNPLRDRVTDLPAIMGWVREYVPPGAVIMARDPVPAYLYARRRTVGYPEGETGLSEAISDSGADYVVVSPPLGSSGPDDLDDFTRLRLLPLLTSQADAFPLVARDPARNASLFAVRAGP